MNENILEEMEKEYDELIRKKDEIMEKANAIMAAMLDKLGDPPCP